MHFSVWFLCWGLLNFLDLWIYTFHQVWKFFTYISSDFFLFHLFLFSGILTTHILGCLKFPHSAQIWFSIFFNSFFFLLWELLCLLSFFFAMFYLLLVLSSVFFNLDIVVFTSCSLVVRLLWKFIVQSSSGILKRMFLNKNPNQSVYQGI